MSHLLKVILTFKNQKPRDLIHLTNLIYKGDSLIHQKILIISPHNEIIHYSKDRLENIKLSNALSFEEISPEFCIKFKQDYAKFKFECDEFNKKLK